MTKHAHWWSWSCDLHVCYTSVIFNIANVLTLVMSAGFRDLQLMECSQTFNVSGPTGVVTAWHWVAGVL